MATIPVGFAQVNWIMGGAALPLGAQTTLGVAYPPGITAADIANRASLAWVNNMRPTYTTDCTLLEVYVKQGPNSTGASASLASVSPGSAVAPADNPNTATLVHKLTAFGGRSGRGRFYLPGTPASAVAANGTIIPASLVAFNAALTAFYTALNTAGLEPVLLHGPGAPLTTPTSITSFNVDSTAATQRRRLRR